MSFYCGLEKPNEITPEKKNERKEDLSSNVVKLSVNSLVNQTKWNTDQCKYFSET